MTEPDLIPLTPHGEARREAMLAGLVDAMTRLHRRRRARRKAASAGAACVVLIAVIRWAGLDFPAGPRARTVERGIPYSVSPDVSTPRIAVVLRAATDPDIMARLKAEPGPLVALINDQELLNTLVLIGRPAGLIRFGDRVALSNPVTDDELNINPLYLRDPDP